MLNFLRKIFKRNTIIVGYGFPACSDTYFEFKYNRETQQWVIAKYDRSISRPKDQDIDLDLIEYDKRATKSEIQSVKDYLRIRRRR